MQEIKWEGGKTINELDWVLLDRKRVPCSTDLRFTDEEAVKLTRRTGWIISFSKLEELEHQAVYGDWVAKNEAQPKLQYFANCLLKLEETRSGKKVVLNEAQRKQFAEHLCIELVTPTGVDPEILLKYGYFILRKAEETRVEPVDQVEARKREFAALNALPPVVVTPIGMKSLSSKNELLNFESVLTI